MFGLLLDMYIKKEKNKKENVRLKRDRKELKNIAESQLQKQYNKNNNANWEIYRSHREIGELNRMKEETKKEMKQLKKQYQKNIYWEKQQTKEFEYNKYSFELKKQIVYLFI